MARRIIAALVAFFIVVLVLAKVCSGCSSDVDILPGTYSPATIEKEEEVEPEKELKEAIMLAQTIYGEGRGLNKYEKSLIAWSVCNRVDDERFPNTIEEVITQPHQFAGYSPRHPIDDECYIIACDVLTRWELEHKTGFDYGRTLPSRYVSFWGDGKHNYFRTADKKDIFDFSTPDPYGSDKEAIK